MSTNSSEKVAKVPVYWSTILLGLIVAAIFLVAIFSYQVQETERALVITWGKITGEQGPGLHLRLPLPIQAGKMLVSLSEKPEDAAVAAKNFADLGFEIVGTEGTVKFLWEKGVPAKMVAKIGQGRPDVLDLIKNREVTLILNTPSNRRDARADDNSILRAAIKYRVPYLTTIAAALAASEGIKAAREGKGEVRSLQSYHAAITVE